MFGIGIPELVVVLVVALLFVGPERLPELAKFLGKIFTEFRKATDDVTEELRSARLMLEDEIRQAEHETREEKSAQTASRLPENSSPEIPASVPRTKGNPDFSSTPEKKESSSGEPS